MLLAFLLLSNFCIFTFGQESVSIEGVPFNVKKLAKKDDSIVIYFENQAFLTDESNLPEVILDYYYSSDKDLNFNQTLALVKALLNSNKKSLLRYPLKRICSLTAEERYQFTEKIFKLQNSLELEKYIPSVDPDPECVLAYSIIHKKQLDFTLTDERFFLLKLNKLLGSILNLTDINYLINAVVVIDKVLDKFATENPLKYENILKTRILYLLITRSALEGVPEWLNKDTVVDDNFKNLLQKINQVGLLNCNNLVLIHLNLDLIKDFYDECVKKIFLNLDVTTYTPSLSLFCEKFPNDCFNNLEKLISKDTFTLNTQSLELLLKLTKLSNPDKYEYIGKKILYKLYQQRNKTLIKYLELKHRLSLGIFEKLKFFLIQNALYALLISVGITFIAVFTIKLFKEWKLEKRKEDTQKPGTFVKVQKRLKTESPEYKEYLELLEFFSVKGEINMDNLKKAYFELSKIYHPDRYQGDKSKFIEIKNKYERLKELFAKFN